MKITMDITYNGKKYTSLDDATLAAALHGIEEITKKRLRGLEGEIAKEGAIITIKAIGDNIESLGNASVNISNASPELINKIKIALGQSHG